jgi:hypothetical protein
MNDDDIALQHFENTPNYACGEKIEIREKIYGNAHEYITKLLNKWASIRLKNLK